MPRLSDQAYRQAWGRRGGTQSVPTETNPGRRSRSVKGCVVYFVAAPSLGRVKIGRTKDLRKRLRSLEGGSPVELELLGKMAGGPAVELFLHAAFDGQRIQSEWFELTPEIEAVAVSSELPVSELATIELDSTRVAGDAFRRFALVEQALAEGHDSPTSIAGIAGCTPDDLGSVIGVMQAFGFMRGTFDPNGNIRILAA